LVHQNHSSPEAWHSHRHDFKPEQDEEHRPEFGAGRSRGSGRDHGDRTGRRFERGDLRYVLLEQLAEQPAHGYELIRALGDRFHGFYTPSPGTIYPTLQWLEDLGYITAAEADGRRVYTISEAGRGFLADNKARVAAIGERMRDWMGPFDRREYRAVVEASEHDLDEMARTLRKAGSLAGQGQLRRMREVIRRARWDVESILEEPDRGPSGDAPSTASDEETRHA